MSKLVGLLLCLSLVACDTGPDWNDPGPRDTFQTFLLNWYRGDRVKAFAAILPADREVLTKPLSELGEVPDAARPKADEMLVVASIDNPYDIDRMEVTPKLEGPPKEGKRVALKLFYQDGTTGQAHMVWGGDRWYVDLPLEDTPGAAAGKPKKMTGSSDDGTDGPQ